MTKRSKKSKAVAASVAETPVAPIVTKDVGGGSGWLSDPASLRFFGSGLPTAGVPVTQASALTVPAFYCGVRAISEDTAKMKLLVNRPTPNYSGFVAMFGHPLNDVIENPNPWQSRYDLIAFAAASYAMKGNSYIVIIRQGGARPAQLIPINPDICQPQLLPDGRVVYCVTHPLVEQGGAVWVRSEDMLHTKGFSLNGWLGISPIVVMAESLGVSIATQAHASKLFGQGISISGVVEYPGALSPEAAKRLAESFRQSYAGPANAHLPAVLEEGAKFSRMGLAPEEAQFLQTRAFQLSDLARALRIPKHKLQDLSDAHYDNLESQEQTYINDTLRPFCDRFEAECRNKLLMPADRKLGLEVRFDFDSMIRGTTKDRYANYAIGKQNGWLSTDDIRRAEGLPDLPDGQGQVYRESLATAPATNGTEEPNKVPPTGTPTRQETTH